MAESLGQLDAGVQRASTALSAPSSPVSAAPLAQCAKLVSNGVTHTVSSNSGSGSGGIKVKIKRTGSTDSRQVGPQKSDLHEIIHPSGNIGSQIGSKRPQIGGNFSPNMKKEKLKLTVTSAGTGDYSLSDKIRTLSSSLESSPSTVTSSSTGSSSGSGSSAASSPVITTRDQPFIPNSKGQDSSTLKRHLTNSSPEPPAKKTKASRDDNVADDNQKVNCAFTNGSSSEKENEESESDPTSDGKFTQTGTMTEPEMLGTCEPGTVVKLNGVVFQESEKGMLVLNVSWKGRSFMGALINCSKTSEDHKWGPPKDPAMCKRKRGRGNRSRTPPVKIPISKKGKPNGVSSGKATGKERAQRLPRVNYGESDDEDLLKGIERSCGDTKQASPTSQYIECPKPHCSKKFPVLEALKYHLSSNHVEDDDVIRRKKPTKSPKAALTTTAAASSVASIVETLATTITTTTATTTSTNEKAQPEANDQKSLEEEKPTDLSTPAVNGSNMGQVKNRPPPPPTTSSIKPSPNIQGVNYLSSVAKSLDGPPNAHSSSVRQAPPPLVHNGNYPTTSAPTGHPLALNNKPKATKPPGGPVSPAYSDISDEETPPVPPPTSAPSLPVTGRIPSIPGGLFDGIPGGARVPNVPPKPSPGVNLSAGPIDRKTDGSAPTTQTIGPPPQHLPPELHGGSLMFPPVSSSMMNQYAAMIAAITASGQRLPMPPGLPFPGPGKNPKALDVMAQHASNYSATRKLQEMQENVTKKPPSIPSQPPRTPPSVPRPPQSSTLPPSSQPPVSMFDRVPSVPTSSAASNLLRHEHNHTHLHLGYPPGFPPPVSSADLVPTTSVLGAPRGALPPSALPPAAHGAPPHPSLLPGLFGPPGLPSGFRLPANYHPK